MVEVVDFASEDESFVDNVDRVEKVFSSVDNRLASVAAFGTLDKVLAFLVRSQNYLLGFNPGVNALNSVTKGNEPRRRKVHLVQIYHKPTLYA